MRRRRKRGGGKRVDADREAGVGRDGETDEESRAKVKTMENRMMRKRERKVQRGRK